MHTICFHTRDAIARAEGTFTFETPRHLLPRGASKVVLASCEFPMVQYTVEEAWNRLYYNEGVRFDDEDDRVLRVQVDGGAPCEVRVPRRINPLRSCVCKPNGDLYVECAHPHGLWSDAASQQANVAVFADGWKLLGTGTDDGELAVYDSDRCTAVSATAFVVHGGGAAAGGLYLHVPTCASPERACAWLTSAARGAVPQVRLTFRYDLAKDVVRLHLQSLVPKATTVRLLPTPLAQRLGLAAPFDRAVPPGSDLGADAWPSDASCLWDFATLAPGFYGPCHRPMCTGAPLRFPGELELAVNRLYFPVLPPGQDGKPAEHLVVFGDAAGRTHACLIPPGRYTPAQLCSCLSRGMTAVVGGTLEFRVTYDDDRFTFACARPEAAGGSTARGANPKSSASGAPVPFALHFHHPLSVAADRFGFAPQPLAGAASYTAAVPTRVVHTDRARDRTAANVLRVSEVGAEKRFCFHAVAPPPMIGVVQSSAGSLAGGGVTLLLHTYVRRQPFVHGFQQGDVVRLAPPGADDVLPETTPTKAHLPDALGIPAIVLAPQPDDAPGTVRVHAHHRAGLGDKGTCLHLGATAEPWNLCFCRPRALPGQMVGFPNVAVQHGRDGCSGAGRPPFLAPHVHNLDHPDYVLLTFSESQGGPQLTHTFDGETKAVFCKLSLYPLFREERMLPRDTAAHYGLGHRFTLGILNPDGRTPYHFHGKEFSFSLTFVS